MAVILRHSYSQISIVLAESIVASFLHLMVLNFHGIHLLIIQHKCLDLSFLCNFINMSCLFRCRAVVGYIGRRQKLTLGPGCIWVARVLHELFHVLGFFHEHTRPDRDDYVIVHKNNIKPGQLKPFR